MKHLRRIMTVIYEHEKPKNIPIWDWFYKVTLNTIGHYLKLIMATNKFNGH
jgi:hypothetical protein